MRTTWGGLAARRSRVSRHCRPRKVTSPFFLGLAVAAVAILSLASTPSHAQTAVADFSADLQRQSIQGNPNSAPTFVPPGNATTNSTTQNQAFSPDRFTPSSATGAAPVYGSPTGFGAGDTGFD